MRIGIQEATGVVTSQVAMCAILEAACNTPPQVDVSTYRNAVRALRKGGERVHAFLALLRPFTSFLSTPTQLTFANDQGNESDKSKSGKKNKSKPEKQGDREQQEQQKPKTKG